MAYGARAENLIASALFLLYLHILFTMALLGQNIAATFLLVAHLPSTVRYARSARFPQCKQWRCERIHLLGNAEKRALLSLALPPKMMLYTTCTFSCVQLLLSAVVGPLLSKLGLLQNWTKTVLNSVGVWGTSDVFPLVVNAVSSVILLATSVSLCVFLRRQMCYPSCETNRSFRRCSLLLLAMLAVLTALIYPSYEYTFLLVVHFFCISSFFASRHWAGRVRFLEVISKGCTLGGLLLLSGSLLAQSPLEQQLLLLGHGRPNNFWSIVWYESEWVNVFRSTVVFRKGLQLLFLMCTIVASHHVHGSWRIITRSEIKAHKEYMSEAPLSLWQLFPRHHPATLRKVQVAFGHYLPLLVIPLLFLVSLAVMDFVSILMLITSLLGFVLAYSTFVAVLPFCYAVLAFGITLEFVATVDNRLLKPLFMSSLTMYNALFGIALMHCCVSSLLVFTVSMFRGNPIQFHYRTVPEKKAHIQTAFDRLQNRLGELQDIFSQLCDRTTGAVHRDAFVPLVQQVAHTLRLNDNDIEFLWRFLSGGDPVLLFSCAASNETTSKILSDSSTLSKSGRNQTLINCLREGYNNNKADREEECTVKLLHDDVKRNHGSADVFYHVEGENRTAIDDDSNNNTADTVNEWNELRQRFLEMQLVGVDAPNQEGREKANAEGGCGQSSCSRGEECSSSSRMHQDGVAQRQAWWHMHASTESAYVTGLHVNGSGISYLDFLVLVSEIEEYRMTQRGTMCVVAAMVKEILLLNMSTLTLVAMFVVSMTMQNLDLLNGIYLLFFLGLACLPQYVQRCWCVVVAYTMLHITVRFIALAYFRTYGHGAPPEQWIIIFGIYTDVNPFLLFAYFVLLTLAVFQMRFSCREEKGTITIQEILQRVEWRRYVECAFFPQLRQNLLTLTTALVLAVMALFIPRNIFIAGFALLFLLYVSLGTYSKRAEGIALVVLTAYNMVVLLVSALYHVPDISELIFSRLSSVSGCQNVTTVAVCASEIGLPVGADHFVPISLDLLSWYLATALSATLCQERFGGRRRKRNTDTHNDNLNDEVCEMNSICKPLLRNGVDTLPAEVVNRGREEVDAVYRSTSLSMSKMCVTEMFFHSYANTFGTFTGRSVPLAFEVTRYLYIGVEFVHDIGANNGIFLVLAAVGYASLENFSVFGAAFMALFLFNCVGVAVIAVSVMSIALTYVYPFFFIPEVPLSAADKRFFNLEKNQKNGGLEIVAPLLTCAMAVFYAQTRKSKAVLDGERAARQAIMREVPLHSRRPFQVFEKGLDDTPINAPQMPYVRFVPSGKQGNMEGKAKEPHAGFGTLKQHLMFLWNYIRTRFLADAVFELTMLIVVLGISITLDRITGFFFCIQFLLMWLFGRVRCITELRFALAQELLTTAFLGGMYFIRLGMPSGVIPFAILHSEQCGSWEYYFGCHLPVHHFVLMVTLLLMQRRMRYMMAGVRETIVSVEGTLELGELLRKRAKDIEDCRKLLRSDIENVLPVPSHDIIRNPHTVFDLLIAISCIFLPAATFSFVQGVMMASLIGVVEIVVSLCLLAFKRSLAWRWYVVWPYFILFLFLTFAPQLVVRLPFSPPLVLHDENLMISLGIHLWDHGILVGQSLVLFSAVVQQRIFNEFFFATYLIGLCRGSLTAVERHKEMIEYIQKQNETLQSKVEQEEHALKKKLGELFVERSILNRRVDADVKVEVEMKAETVEEKGENVSSCMSKKAPLIPTAGTTNSESLLGTALHPTMDLLDMRRNTESLDVEPHAIKATNTGGKGTSSEENTHLESQGGKHFCSMAINAMELWSERLIQYFCMRTYRGKEPRRTYSQVYRLIVVFIQFLMTKTAYLCYLLFLVNYALSGTLLDLLLSLSSVLHGMLILPWAGSSYWQCALVYNVTSILTKCVMQVIIQQFHMSPSALYYTSAIALDIGLNRQEPSSLSMALDIMMDFMVFVSIIIHRQICFDYGVLGEDGGRLAEQRRCCREGEDVQDQSDPRDSRSKDHDNDDESIDCGAVRLRTSPQLLERENGVSERNYDDGGSSDDVCGWTRRTWHKLFSHAGNVLYKHWENIRGRHGAGSDYYTVQFWADSVSLVIFVFVYYALAGSSRGNILSSVQQDLLPGPLVVILFSSVILMATERIVYVLHAVHLKFTLHVFTAVGYHAAFMVWRFTLAQRTITPGVILLFVKFFSMMMSALQLRSGYPLHRKHDPFTTNSGVFHWLGHTLYRATPFLFELRLLLDWSVSPTTLKIQHWMLLEDVHHTIYQRYVDIRDLAWTSPKKGRRFPFIVKLYQGILGFTACIIVLFFPLMLYSTFNPNVGANHVAWWRTEMTFGSTSRFYVAEGTNLDIPPTLAPNLWNVLPQLKRDEFGAEGSLQLFTFPRSSAEVWGATPATQLLLLGQLNAAIKNKTPFVIQKTDEVLRVEALPGAQKRVRVTQWYVAPLKTVLMLRDALENAHRLYRQRRLKRDQIAEDTGDAFVYQTSEWISLPQFYSPFVNNIPSDVLLVDAVRADCAVQLNSVGASGNDDGPESPGVLYWCIWCKSFVNLSNSTDTEVNGVTDKTRITTSIKMMKEYSDNVDNKTNMYAIVASSDVAINASFSFLPNLGIVALYTTFIFALGSFLRSSVTGHAHRVVLMQVSNPDPIAELLRYIYMARSSASNGCLESLSLEQQLFFELVDMLRSSERVLALSGRRVDDYDSNGRFQRRLKQLSDHPF